MIKDSGTARRTSIRRKKKKTTKERGRGQVFAVEISPERSTCVQKEEIKIQASKP